MKNAEQHRLDKINKIKSLEQKQRQQEFLIQLNKEKIKKDEEDFVKYTSKKNQMKIERIKNLFDAEYKRAEVREALEQMPVWNAYDNNIIMDYLEYEKKCKKSGEKLCTVADFVRRRAVRVH